MTAAVVSMTAAASSWPTNLTATERAALATALAPRQLCAPLRAARRILQRFLAPLDEAGVELGLPQRARHGLQRGVLAGMQEHGTPWPAWNAGTWIAVAEATGNQHGATILAVATHLGAATSSDLVSARPHPIHLTRRLFGPAEFEHELGRIQEYLRTVGYGRTAGYRQSVPSALATLFLQVGRAELGAITLDVIESAHAAEPPKSVRRTAYFRIARALHGMGILHAGGLCRRLRRRPPKRSMAASSGPGAGSHTTTRMSAARTPGRARLRLSMSQRSAMPSGAI